MTSDDNKLNSKVQLKLLVLAQCLKMSDTVGADVSVKQRFLNIKVN